MFDATESVAFLLGDLQPSADFFYPPPPVLGQGGTPWDHVGRKPGEGRGSKKNSQALLMAKAKPSRKHTKRPDSGLIESGLVIEFVVFTDREPQQGKKSWRR